MGSWRRIRRNENLVLWFCGKRVRSTCFVWDWMKPHDLIEGEEIINVHFKLTCCEILTTKDF